MLISLRGALYCRAAGVTAEQSTKPSNRKISGNNKVGTTA